MSFSSAEVNTIPVFMEVEKSGIIAAARWRSRLGVLFLATLMLAPLAYGAVQTWAWASLTVLAFLLLFLWGISCIKQGAVKIFWSPLYLPAGLFLVLGVIQLFGHLSVDP